MRVQSRVWIRGRSLIALGMVASGLVFVARSGVVEAAIPPGFELQPPERLYVMPEPPAGPIPAAIVDLLVPVGTLKFDEAINNVDLISMDDRKIVVDFVDTPSSPNPPGPCNIVDVEPDVGYDSDYPIGNCTHLTLSVSHGTLRVGALSKVYQDDPAGDPAVGHAAYAVYLASTGARVYMSDVPVNSADPYRASADQRWPGVHRQQWPEDSQPVWHRTAIEQHAQIARVPTEPGRKW